MKKASPRTDPIQMLRQTALGHADVEEGIACKGTALESATYKVRGKAFLFVRPGKAMVKLESSLDEATKLARENPACCKVGSGGWVTIEIAHAKDLPIEVLTRWIAESYGLFVAGKKPTKGRLKGN
jgi:hypothetical protein